MQTSIERQFEEEAREKEILIKGIPEESFKSDKDFENKFRVYIEMSQGLSGPEEYFESAFT